ncbi:hypothetical protein AAC387_Pa12g0533 [Persea americana]
MHHATGRMATTSGVDSANTERHFQAVLHVARVKSSPTTDLRFVLFYCIPQPNNSRNQPEVDNSATLVANCPIPSIASALPQLVTVPSS